MTQQEFETRTGLTVTSKEFEYIHRVYMATNFQKDDFCKEWKNNATLKTSNIVCDLTMEVETLRRQVDDLMASYNNAQKGAQMEVSSMADFLIEQAEATGSFALREKAIKLIGIKDFLRRKIEAGFSLWEDDRKALTEILTAE